MQEWIIAMLVISVLLVLRDMAKVFFRGRSFLKAEQPAEEKNPQKEKVERYAASFRKLADSFYGLPYRKDYLSNGQVDGIIRETCDEICSHCYQREICWGTQSQEMYRGSERMIRSMEEGNQEKHKEFTGRANGLMLENARKVALYGMETEEYGQFLADTNIKKVKAMKSSK